MQDTGGMSTREAVGHLGREVQDLGEWSGAPSRSRSRRLRPSTSSIVMKIWPSDSSTE